MTDVAQPTIPSLVAPEVAADPHAFYRLLRERAPLHHDERADAYLLSRHADVKEAYRHPDLTTTVIYKRMIGTIYGNSLPQMEGEEHAWWRRVLNPYFRGSMLHDRWTAVIAENTQRLLADATYRQTRAIGASFSQGDEMDLVEDLLNRLPMCIVFDMLGLPAKDYEQFIAWHGAQMSFLGNVAGDPDVHARGLAATEELHDYLEPLIDERRRSPGEDLISALATQVVAGEQLEPAAVITRVMEIVNSGSDTTGKTMAGLFAQLLSVPSRVEQVRRDRSLIPGAVAETLRLMPPSQMNARTTTCDVNIAGGKIPAGSTVWLLLASANRDERRFERADEFDLHRSDLDVQRVFTSTGEIFSFGYGEHHCLGALFAREEIGIVVDTVLDMFPRLRLADPDFVPQEVGLKYRAVQSLPVVL